MQLSRVGSQNAERDTHRIMVRRFHLSLQPWVPLSEIQVDNRKLTVLRLKTWMEFLLRKHCMHICAGLKRPHEERQDAIFDEFWSRYKCSNPEHPVFNLEREGRLRLSRCIPVVYHGDEGRGRRRHPFLVTSFTPILGRGTQPADRRRKKFGIRKDFRKLQTNFKGHSYTNRWLQVAWKIKYNMHVLVSRLVFSGMGRKAMFLGLVLLLLCCFQRIQIMQTLRQLGQRLFTRMRRPLRNFFSLPKMTTTSCFIRECATSGQESSILLLSWQSSAIGRG